MESFHIFLLLDSNLILLRSGTNLNSLKLLTFVLRKAQNAWPSHSPSCISLTQGEYCASPRFSSWPCSLKTLSKWQAEGLTSFVSLHSDVSLLHYCRLFCLFLVISSKRTNAVPVAPSWLQVDVSQLWSLTHNLAHCKPVCLIQH